MEGWPASIGLVGAGAMGRALVAGLVRGRPDVAGTLAIADAVPAAVEAAVADAGGRPATLAEAAAADLVVRRGQAQGRAATRWPRWPPACAPGR